MCFLNLSYKNEIVVRRRIQAYSDREVWGGEGLLVGVLLDLDGEVGGVELGQDQPQHQHRVHYQTPLLRRGE